MHVQSASNRKSVSFCDRAKLRLGLHIKDYRAEERQAVYYDRSECRRFKRDAEITASFIENDQPLVTGSSEFCARGIECLTKQGSKKQSTNRKKAVLAVLCEQERFKRIGADFDTTAEEQIAAVYREALCECAASAHRMGLLDARNVREERPAQETTLSFTHFQHGSSAQGKDGLFSESRRRKEKKSTGGVRRVIGSAAVRSN